MSPDGVSFGRSLRDRRKALGLTQDEVAEAAEVTPSTLGRWERDESNPIPVQIDRLKGILRLSDAEASVWGSRLTPPPPPPLRDHEISIEITRDDPIPEEWLPPRQRVRPPVLDRAALQGRKVGDRHLAPVIARRDPFGPARSKEDDRVRETMREGVERRAKRRQARDERRRKRDSRRQTARTAAEHGGEGAFALPRAGAGSGYAPQGYSPSSHLEEYLSYTNTGSMFPMPSNTKGRQKYTYSDDAPTLPRDWPRYLRRTLALVIVLVVLTGVGVWALFELGEGWTAVVDLFRDHSPATTSVPRGELTDALGLWYLGL